MKIVVFGSALFNTILTDYCVARTTTTIGKEHIKIYNNR